MTIWSALKYSLVKKTLLSFFLVFLYSISFAQISLPGTPVSKHIKRLQSVPVVPLLPVKAMPKIPAKTPEQPQTLFAGYTVSVPDSVMNKGIWQKSSNGIYVWRVGIHLTGAHALNLYFRNVQLAHGDRLFIYNADRSKILGAFSDQNNGRFLATGMIPGSSIIVELDSKSKYKTLPFSIKQMGNITHMGLKSTLNFGDAGSCEVPVNCSEGDHYQNQKRGVARILLKSAGSLYWCSGSLINDTKNDGTPYFLTANHCGSSASATDYQDWVFYFNYESPDCSRPATPPASQTMSGATLLAHASEYTSLGSDFKLLKLNNDVPVSYNPYFNGWDASGNGSSQGVTIHHPEGDIKMISTYNTALVPTSYLGSVKNTDGLYWQVHWAVTADGHGVTEPGSSGSPLFNDQGLVIGTLTGGDAACGTPNQPDYYGRFSKSFDQNGTDSTRQLKYWLDKSGTGITQMPGFDPNNMATTAFFSSNIQTVPINGKVQFVNLSTGPITSYHWEFEGGTPATSDQKNPPLIQYATTGNYTVTLTVESTNGPQKMVRSNYIAVKPMLYPNPVKDGIIHILLGTYNENDITIEVYNMLGQKLRTFTPSFTSEGVTIRLPDNQNGMYVVRLTNHGETHIYKVLNLHK
jgi:PKD repeat protein